MATPLEIISGTATPKRTLEALGSRVRARRSALGLTQGQLAERSGVSVATLRNLEHHGRATLKTVVEVARALGCDSDLDALFAKPAYRTIEEVVADGANRKPRG